MQLSSKARKAVAIGLAASTIVWAGSLAALPLVASAAVHSEGCLVLSSGTVWLITSGSRRGFTSEPVFTSNGYNFLQVVSASAEDVALPVGPIMVYGDGTLVKGPSDPLVYLVVSGQKRGFISGSVFTNLGFLFANVKSAPANTFADLPTGANITASTSASSLPLTGVAAKTVACTMGDSTSTTLQGGAGDATISTVTTDVETQVKEGDSNVKVAAFKVEALDSDIQLKSVKVVLAEQGTGGSTRLDHYFDSVSVWEGSTKVGSADASDFTKDGSVYSKSISLDASAVVREGSSNKETFYVAATALSNIDSLDLGTDNNEWVLQVPNIRFVDAQGAVLSNTDGDSGTIDGTGDDPGDFGGDFSFVSVADSGDVTVTVSKASGNPDDSTVEVSDTSTTKNVLLLQFKVKAEGSSMTFDTLDTTLDVTLNTPGDPMISEFQLRNGTSSSSSLLATEDGVNADGTVTFNLDDDFTIDADSTETFSVFATINDVDNFTEGDDVAIDFQDFHSSLTDDNGDAFADGDVDGSALGSVITFLSEGAQATFVSDSFTAEDTSGDPTVDGTISMKVKITAFGGNDVVLNEDCSDITYDLGDETDDGCIMTSSTTTTDGSGDFTIGAGDTETFTISVKFADTSGFVQLELTDVDGSPVTNVKTQAF